MGRSSDLGPGSRYDILVKVDDDWYPNLPGDQVRVSVIWLHGEKNIIRVCAWGGDDTGMELDSRFRDTEDGKRVFKMMSEYADSMKELEPLDREIFRFLGWKMA